MELFGLLEHSDKRLLIDSSLQHASMALNLPSTVLWLGTDPKIFGYNFHTNIVANLNDEEFKLADSYLFDYNFLGTLHECPVSNQTTLFNVEDIIGSLNKKQLF